ncbi:MAG: type II toxin-antitoxin system VapC family toxin [Candidatus Geothermarchaeales archaeon]
MKIFLDSNFLIYMNTMTNEERESLDELFRKLLEESLFTNMLVVDETLYVSKRFGLPYDVTFDFLRGIVLPHIQIIPIDEEDIILTEKYLLKYGMKPSDAIHLSTMEKSGINRIVTEDEDFDRVEEVKRVWLNTRHGGVNW